MRRKNQWSRRSCSATLGGKKSKYSLGTFIKGGLTVLISVLIIYGIAQAGTITPPTGTPSAKFYTLSQIYEFITNNTTATEGDHDFTFSDSLAGTGHTLTEIYNALANLISADKVKLGTTYLGTAGTLVPSGGDAAAANVLAGKTFFGANQTDWDLATGTMTNVGQQIITPGTSNTAITQGYHDGTGYCEGDPDLIADNIKSGIDLFGISGTLTPNGGTATVDDLFNGKTANLTADWTLDTGALNLACNTSNFNGTGNLVADAYDGDGNGTNRWCMTDSGDAVAGDILSNKIAWVDGVAISGTMTNVGQQIITPGTSNTAITQGYHDGTGYCEGDPDLVSSNIKSGINIFGVAGDSNVVDTSSGNATASDIISDKIAWVDGTEITGSFASSTATATTEGEEITPSAGTWLSKVTVAITNLIAGNIRKWVTVGGVAGTYSGYPGTGWTGTGGVTDASSCEANSGWHWFEDANGDGDTTDPEDGICVQANPVTAVWSWNGAEQIVNNGCYPTACDDSHECPEDGVNNCATSTDASTSNTLQDTNASWTPNEWKNYIVKIEQGTAAGCWGRIKSNDANTLTLYGSWLASDYTSNCGTPDSTSYYKIYDDDKYDNSWIGDWTCKHGDHALNGTVSWGSYPTADQVGGTNHIALATTDCYDGTRDLLPVVDESANDSRIVWSGTAESGNSTTLTDNDASWDTNVWIGEKVKIFSGTSAGSEGIIESNTDTTLTVESWSAGNPGNDSQYGIIYIVPHASYTRYSKIDGDSWNSKENNGPLKANALNNWKGSRLPSSSDFFGLCGSGGTAVDGDYKTGCSNNKYFGNYGGQIGRTDECLSKANSGSWEWLSEQGNYHNARAAGNSACSYFSNSYVYYGYRFRAVFRP